MSGQPGILIGADYSRSLSAKCRHLLRLVCASIVVFAASQAVQTAAVIPFRLATNLMAQRLAGPAKGVTGNSSQIHQVWWDLKDELTYGIPFLLKEDKRTVACCGCLLLLLTALTYRSLRIRTQRGRHAEKPDLVPERATDAAGAEEPTEHPDHPAELHH